MSVQKTAASGELAAGIERQRANSLLLYTRRGRGVKSGRFSSLSERELLALAEVYRQAGNRPAYLACRRAGLLKQGARLGARR